MQSLYKSPVALLSEKTINQIAAGEVVEKPDSVIRELIENSIDAGATKITIEIKAGGLQLIRIIDDGSGMNRADAQLCLLRHTTSKIREIDDLSSLSTLGFRGEALASIASISKLTLITSTGEEEGVKIDEEGKTFPVARNRGTTIEVRSLFYNVPARKKFQKSPAICKADIHKLVQVLSLAHTAICFELIADEKSLFNSAVAADSAFFPLLDQKITTIYGEQLLENCLKIDKEERGYHLKGYIGNVSETRPNRSSQFLFVNERNVYSSPLSFAVKNGFGMRIAQSRFPLFFLHLTLPSHLVDVNVHPQKKEVKFQEEAWLKAWIEKLVSARLSNQSSSFAMDFDPKEERIVTGISSFFNATPFTPRPVASAAFVQKEPVKQQMVQASLPLSEKEITPIGIYGHFLLLRSSDLPEALEEDALVFLDLRLAEAELLYQQLLKKEAETFSDALLIPITLSMPKDEFSLLLENCELLQEIGFDLRPFGQQQLIIEAIPASFLQSEVEPFFSELAQQLSREELPSLKEKKEKIAALCATKALQRKRTLSLAEGRLLAKKLFAKTRSIYCFNGKKIFLELSCESIQKLFRN